jgi:DNA-directed RNA polymerase subunit RPC12/RpoP
MDTTALVNYVPDSTVPIVTGCVAFGATLCLSTLAQKIVGISTATKVTPSVFGFATVCLASMASQRAAICTHEWIQDTRSIQKFVMDPKTRKKMFSLSSTNSSNDYFQIGNKFKIPYHDVRVCAVGLAAFKLLGGRFWAISPSSFTHLGSFARWSIPCGKNYATTNQRTMVEKMGRKWGCHTCGSRMLVKRAGKHKFAADHMPPKSVADQMNKSWLRRLGPLPEVQFRFYPQCTNCSNTQGSILSKASNQIAGKRLMPSSLKATSLKQAGGGRAAHFHGLHFRVNHLAGGVLAGATVVSASSNSDVSNGNKKRFKSLTGRMEELVKKSTTSR